MSRHTKIVALGVILLLALAAVSAVTTGCKAKPATTPSTPSVTPTTTPTTPTTTSTTTPTTPETTPPTGQVPPPLKATPVAARVYFVRDEKMGAAGRNVPMGPGETTTTPTFLERVVKTLLKGPNPAETEFGLTTAIPKSTQVLGVARKGKTAVVDLSSAFESGGGSLSMMLRVAQVVCTLTQFKEFDNVAFRIDGAPVKSIGGEGIIVAPNVSRADIEDQLPPVLVESPTPGQLVKSPVNVWGSSNVFEAVSQLEITDPDGLIIAKKTVHATSGSGTRGTFSVNVPFKTKRSGLGEVISFVLSAKDGSRQDIVEIPVNMKK